MVLRVSPGEPPATAIYLYGRYLAENEDWARYLEGW
jgi:hypothetical protein